MTTPSSPLPSDQAARVVPSAPQFGQLDEATLLTTVELKSAPDIRVATISPDRVIIKHERSRNYLTLTPAQWRALQTFGPGPGRTVPQILFRLISDRDCIPLREFYETTLKAFRAGVLECVGSTPPVEEPPTSWKWRLASHWVRGFALITAIGTVALLIRQPPQLPQHIGHLLSSWVAICLAISASAWAAAAVVCHAHAEIYHPQFHWKTFFPRFSVDLDDAIMAGQPTVITAGLASLAPTLCALGLAAGFAPQLVVPLFFAWLFLISPFWASPGLKIIRALYAVPTLDSDRNFAFQPNRALQHAFKTLAKKTDLRFFGIHALLVFIWLGLILATGTLLLDAHAATLWQTLLSTRGLHFTALTLLVSLSLIVVSALGALAWLGYVITRDWWHEKRRRSLLPEPASITPETIAALIANSLLFKSLPHENRTALAAAAETLRYPAGATILSEGDAGDKIFLVATGRLEVMRELDNGRLESVAKLACGDMFGEIALLRGTRRTRSVRSLNASVLLSFSRLVFEQLVFPKISREAIELTIQKIAFLHRIPLSRNWALHAMHAFAENAFFQDFEKGSALTSEDQYNEFFYILYEGELSVQRRKQEIAALTIGDFFGEISHLQNGVANATILARTPARCLLMNKRDFLQFLVKDFTISITFEEISSKRLGYPVFPLKGKSLDLFQE